MNNCPTCGHAWDGKVSPIEYDGDGLPFALAIRSDLGLPEIEAHEAMFRVFLDGEKLDSCVGFDRKAGFVWTYTTDDGGGFVRRNGDYVISRREGAVTVERLAA